MQFPYFWKVNMNNINRVQFILFIIILFSTFHGKHSVVGSILNTECWDRCKFIQWNIFAKIDPNLFWNNFSEELDEKNLLARIWQWINHTWNWEGHISWQAFLQGEISSQIPILIFLKPGEIWLSDSSHVVSK